MSVPIERKILEKYAVGQGLNIGCGKVRLGNSIGIDLDPQAPAVDRVANGEILPYQDGALDYVLSLHSLEHFKTSPVIVLEEWKRVIKPGGLIAVIVPDGDRGEGAWFAGTGKHYQIFTLQTLQLFFEGAGLKVQVCRKVDRNPERPEMTLLCVGEKI